MLSIKNLEAGYGKVKVLHGISMEVPKAKVVTLIGSNGAGKTTTMRALSGMIRPTAGEVTLGGKRIDGLESHRIARLGLAHSPEGRRVFPTLSVTDNLLLGAFPRLTGSRPKGDVQADLGRAMDLFPRLKERRDQLAGTLSGGEQQMLVVGRALMTNPKLLILDEATEGLAPLIRQEIWRCLRALKAEGQTILVIDKNLPEMATLVDRHYIVDKGRVAWSGAPAELSAQPDLAQRYLGI